MRHGHPGRGRCGPDRAGAGNPGCGGRLDPARRGDRHRHRRAQRAAPPLRLQAVAATRGGLARAGIIHPVRADDILGAVGNTPLVGIQRLSPKPEVRLWAKLEGQNPTGSVKDRIALAMIEAAEREGKLRPGSLVLEPTSGNTGIALAMVCARKGYRLTVVIPQNASEERVRLLEMFGAEIVFTPATRGTNGAIEIARRMAEAGDKYFMPFQYGNQANPRAHYEGTGE